MHCPYGAQQLKFRALEAQKDVAADLKLIYSAATAGEAEPTLAEFEGEWDKEYKPISQSWRRNWAGVIPFFDYPPEIRKVITPRTRLNRLI